MRSICDLLLTLNRGRDDAEAFLRTAIRTPGLSEKITLDKSGVATRAIEPYNRDHHTAILIHHAKNPKTISRNRITVP
jgi:transposase-like protein